MYSYIAGEVKSISSGVGPILMSHLYCSGYESSLLDCSHQSCIYLSVVLVMLESPVKVNYSNYY